MTFKKHNAPSRRLKSGGKFKSLWEIYPKQPWECNRSAISSLVKVKEFAKDGDV